MDESRKAFEQAYEQLRKDGKTINLWDVWSMAWTTSRAAIEIRLDDKVMVEDEFDKGHNCAIDYCAAAIRAAGIKVKE